ncbi:MAG: ABC transporter ATP-binding protein [Methylacidiphilales bacterium]|nr:ABC transporter ATP-binding protein [Candidatus Methylacidiphilales bacterium]
MSDYCISVEKITKKYRLGQLGSSNDGLRHHLERRVRALFSPARNSLTDQAPPPRTSGDFLALDQVSFQVKPGEVLGIIGRNGAGKSTLLKILSRITPPTSGQIRVRGRIASLLEVGTGFHPDLTGRENIFLNGAILGMTRSEIVRKLDEIIAFAEIEKFIDTPVKRYSSGMYVRLAFAVAAHLEPEILIVDEVLAVGDAQFQKKCIGKMNEVAQSHGRTVLFVSHQMAAVRKLCHTAVLLTAGTTAGPGPVETVIQEYLGNITSSDRMLDLTKVKHDSYALNTGRLDRLDVDEGCSLAYGDRLAFHLDLTCDSAISGVILGVCFDTTEGYRVLTLDSDVSGKALNFSKGKYRVNFTIPRNPLSPGLYNVGCAMFSGGAVIDSCSAGVWEVVTGQSDVISNRGFGGCRPTFETEVSPI